MTPASVDPWLTLATPISRDADDFPAASAFRSRLAIPDPLIAATAEVAGMTVLHVDKDFELVASLTGQALERLRGDW